MTQFKEIYVNGYRRKDGTWVSPHSRTIQVTRFKYKKTLSSYRGVNPDQLCFDFSGITKNI